VTTPSGDDTTSLTSAPLTPAPLTPATQAPVAPSVTAPVVPPAPSAVAPAVLGDPGALEKAKGELAAKAAEAKIAVREKEQKAAAEKARAAKDARTPDQIRADIAATRIELGQTVDALSAKLDVKSRAKGEAARVQAYVKDPANRPQVIAAAAAVLLLIALKVTRKVKS
jgi:hypothetical protein